MAATYELSAVERTDTGKGVARKLRADSRMPAVVYGPGVDAPLKLSLNSAELRQAITTDYGDRVLLKINVEGKPVLALLKQLQRHPVRQDLLHADLFAVDMATPVEIRIPLTPTEGIPYGVKNEGGVLEWMRRDVTIRVMPDKIPATLEVDTASLRINEAIHAKTAVGDDYELAIPEDTPLCHVVPTRMTLEVVTDEEGEEGEGVEGAEGVAAEGEDAPAAEGEKQD
jgi:large subunit ribosomal protein L25